MNLNDNNYGLSPMANSGTLEEQIDEDAVDDFMNYQPESKKRRLTTEQVRSLEKSFELETKLEPEKKIQLAQELGLQPRQVAVWFQNRRARWKTKQLERDYSVLKVSYDALKSDYEGLQQEKENLLAELESLKQKLDAVDFCREENPKEIGLAMKEASTIGSTTKVAVDVAGGDDSIDIKPFSDFTLLIKEKEYIGPDMRDIKPVRVLLLNEKDIGPVNSDSDCSGNLNKDVKSSNQILTQLAQATTSMKYPPANNNVTGGDSTHDQGLMQLAEALCGIGLPTKAYQQLFRIDENCIHEEACNFFVNVEDQPAASTVPWWDYWS